ncbi:MAG: SufS family cysteine desulfurase [Peptostreptococcus sp.]|uniref:Cysteine desulfurase n=3 Tax=Peptostreptococcus TaxID=1257 RepID=D3MPH3_9FIRM|nr:MULTISPECIES: SufS family cysteine desulfurase [Peptostreptococcus]EFD05965.1 cysteine desulfurase, SufS subfamily [Peptostreptococcus anaerobius 653-L]EKX90996.1 cysteine desulfurase, SufS subfamily [Peptostreptococcus anaerobius VPI 4330 = DSM 2949]MDB8820931.1 SufS family cysteine desulfurase [Peptostreptococcus anaerobius]MDB8826207.1 SufS family cysteine desulfurase [Peptostreptococcus anaerobius]MDB8827353.1 SufS family cysteine desulfurase [Peptostreptococcus anaerobius]
MDKERVNEIRSEFPYLNEEKMGRKIVYFDNGATSQKPQCVIDALSNYYSYQNANPHRGAHYLGMLATDLYEDARKTTKEFLNAKSENEVIFVRNTTEALNLIAYSYGLDKLNPGDEILISIVEHHSNLVTWQFVAQKTGAVLKYVYLNDKNEIDMDSYKAALSEKTKVVALAGASNTVGGVIDVKEVVRLAHEVGAVVSLDCAQLAPHVVMDVQDWDVDFLSFSGHKMYAPMGIGVLYGKYEILDSMVPYMYGGDMIEYVYEQNTTFAPVPARFEAGTQNVGGAVALAEAIRFMQRVGIDNIHEHELALTDYCYKKMAELDFVEIYSTDSYLRSPLIDFNIKDIHSHDVSTVLDTYDIAIRTGHHCAMPLHTHLKLNSTCRVSFAVYNTFEEIDFFIDKLKEVRKVMGYGS